METLAEIDEDGSVIGGALPRARDAIDGAGLNVFGDYGEVAADDSMDGGLEPPGHLRLKTRHPGKLIGELLGTDGIAVGEIDVDDPDSLDNNFKEAGVAILLVAGEGGCDGFDRVAGKNSDAVVGLLGDGGRLVSQGAEVVGREISTLQFLKQEDVGILRGQEGRNVIEAGADGIDVPAGDSDGRTPCFEEYDASLSFRVRPRSKSHGMTEQAAWER